MKLLLTVLGLTMVLMFGAITAVQSYTPAGAVTDDADDVSTCRDDGDDGAENPDLPDNPDNEDNPEAVGTLDPHDPQEVGDPQDDPVTEWDDTCASATEPGGVMGETETPTPAPTATPCPTPGNTGAQGDICCPAPAGVSGQGPGVPCCPGPLDVSGQLIDPCLCLFSGGDVGGEGPDICCIIIPFLCCNSASGGEVGQEGIFCCDSASGGEVGAEGPLCCPPFCGLSADADCDGEVTAADAYTTLTQLGGVAETADSCSGGGDADCSGAIDAQDTLAILKILAGVGEPSTC